MKVPLPPRPLPPPTGPADCRVRCYRGRPPGGRAAVLPVRPGRGRSEHSPAHHPDAQGGAGVSPASRCSAGPPGRRQSGGQRHRPPL